VGESCSALPSTRNFLLYCPNAVTQHGLGACTATVHQAAHALTCIACKGCRALISVQLGVHSGTAWQGSWAATATGSTGLASSNWLACVTLNERCSYELHSINEYGKQVRCLDRKEGQNCIQCCPWLSCWLGLINHITVWGQPSAVQQANTAKSNPSLYAYQPCMQVLLVVCSIAADISGRS
jgi:hypothetical protein